MMTVVEVVDESTVKCIWFDVDHHKIEDTFPTVILMNESNPQPRD